MKRFKSRIGFLVAFVCGAVLLNCSFAQAQKNGKAYIWVGDISPSDLSLALRSPFGTVDPYKELQPLINEQKKKMEAKGYQVTIVDNVTAIEIEQVINDPQTKALAFFGHGDENVGATFGTLQGEDIVPGDIKAWAQKKLAGTIGNPKSWVGLDKAEQKRRKTLWDNAHFDLDYVYMHSCYSLKDNSMADVLISNDGEFKGYKGKSFLTDTSVPGKSNLARLQDTMNQLKEKFQLLKQKLDASGGHDAATSKEMTATYKEFMDLKTTVEILK
jgi:hypothetical protein